MEIILNNVKKSFGEDLIIENASFVINQGDHIGLVGNNGSGKSTILKMIKGIEDITEGSMTIRKDATIGYLNQIPNYDLSTYEVLSLAVEDIIKKEKKLEEFEKQIEEKPEDMKILTKYGNLQEEFINLGGYEIHTKINSIITGLKIPKEWLDRRFDSLSGGEKTIVILGKILIENPDILLLDEPTNHLDMHAVMWLEKYLSRYQGTILIVSHDRYFLDKATNKTIDIYNKSTNIYHGNYSFFVKEKKKMEVIIEKNYTNQQRDIKKMEEAIRRFEEWGRNSDNPKFFKKAENMRKRIEKMEKAPKLEKERKINQVFKNGSKSGKTALTIKNLSKSYDDKIILDDISLKVTSYDKVVIIGKNGSGKSTLYKIIQGNLDFEGELLIPPSTKVGFLDQEIKYEEDITITDYLRKFIVGDLNKIRNILANFLFVGNDVFKKINILSGGEKVRLELCKLMHKDVNFLLLDEPTNHLDISAKEVLEDLLLNYQGTLFIISHDRYFINKISNHLIEIENGKTNEYMGNYDYFLSKKYNGNEV